MAINESHPFHPISVERVQFGYNYFIPFSGGMNSRLTHDEGNYSIGDVFSYPLDGSFPLRIPNNQIGLLPGQVTILPLNLVIEFTAKSISDLEANHTENYIYQLVVHAGSDAYARSPLQLAFIVIGLPLIIILLIIVAYKKKK
jgi:hypothetical protein